MSNEKVNFSEGRSPAIQVSPGSEGPEDLQEGSGPSLAPYQSYISFGSVALFSQNSQMVYFQNRGNRPLVLRNFQSTDVAFQASQAQLTILPGESRMLRIVFSPPTARSYSASLSFSSNDLAHASGSLFLSGTGR